ncbi:ubiquitin-associated protein 1-like isoform X1 [Triplophysa rosa]|nr:ubiquitin-associated protein 1-like isoform X1 [Triplophysa rosa]
MSCLDEVPLKMPLGFLEEAKEEVKLITAPEISVPDYLKILQDTEYVFSLENWVLTDLQSGYQTLGPRCEQTATCPPYWMMFSSPQESRLASRWSSDFWEPNPRPRSRSLNAAHYRAMKDRVKFTISDSEDEEFNEEDGTANSEPRQGGSGLPREALGLKDLNTCGSSDFLNLPSPFGLSTQSGGTVRQSSLCKTRRNLQRSQRTAGHPRVSFASSNDHAQSECISTLGRNKQTTKARGSSPPPAVAPSRPLHSHTASLDSSVELLSALSPEERELLAAVTERGYPLRTAIIALQKKGRQSPEQILRYLVACDRLCELGYDEAQVEEALEMFQNCETKAEEFLHLLVQFNEMGFQQNAIKEVLLVHENHRERALEELMTRVA